MSGAGRDSVERVTAPSAIYPDAVIQVNTHAGFVVLHLPAPSHLVTPDVARRVAAALLKVTGGDTCPHCGHDEARERDISDRFESGVDDDE